jgi:hypothetical protein
MEHQLDQAYEPPIEKPMTALVAHSLNMARHDYQPTAVDHLADEIRHYANAVGLTCVAVQLRQDEHSLIAVAAFDLRGPDGTFQKAEFRAPLVTVH